jgi:hypothetical protein
MNRNSLLVVALALFATLAFSVRAQTTTTTRTTPTSPTNVTRAADGNALTTGQSVGISVGVAAFVVLVVVVMAFWLMTGRKKNCA